MDGMYGLNSAAEYSDKALMSPDNLILPSDYQTLLSSSSSSGAFASFRDHHHHHRIPIFGSEELLSAAASAISEASEIQREELDMSTIIKAKIASHPGYPRLLQAYIDCQKVGAPPEIASLLDEIRQENDLCKIDTVSTCLGADPELDEFMETYCDMLVKYKSDLSRPFDEATTFLNKIQMQLSNLSTGASIRTLSAWILAKVSTYSKPTR
nr:homeobox protein knotted-1-like 6 [Quercus suber]